MTVVFRVTQGFSRKIVQKLLITSGLLVELEYKSNLARIKPWTISIRGHYSHFERSKAALLLLKSELESFADKTLLHHYSDNVLLVQYGLGDLTHLSSKTLINPKIVDAKVTRIISMQKTHIRIYLLTDSPKYITNLPLNFIPSSDFSLACLCSIDTIVAGVSTQHFVGTNSKLPLCTSIFRILCEKPTSRPEGVKQQLGCAPDQSFVNFYCTQNNIQRRTFGN